MDVFGGRSLMPATYSFKDRLQLSEGVSEASDIRTILLESIPGALNVHQAATENDKNGTDWWVEHCTGKHLSVDAKVREEDWSVKREDIAADDLALETWSVVEKSKVGWTRDRTKRSDFILWLWMDTGRWCMVPFPMLCHVFSSKWQEWKDQHKTSRQFTPEFGGYHSECVFVPRREVWKEIYHRFA